TRLTEADVYMSVGPLFHGNSQFLAAYPALIAGCRYVMHERFSATQWTKQVREAGATVTNFVGVMMDFVWQQDTRPDDADNNLRCIFAAPTANSILDGFKERFGVAAFVEGFGLTETCMPILSPYGVDRPAGAAGLLNRDWYDVRLVNSETDEEVPIGEVGELTVRPRYPWTSCQGYFGMEDKTNEAFRNLWFHTGDGLRRDEDGWYYFVDRLKDAIRRRGENISSYEVEQGLVSHQALAEVAAIGVPADQEAGEDEVMIFVVVEAGATITAEQIWGYADEQLPVFAIPRYIRFLDELPKTPSEKIRKIALRELGVDENAHDRGPQTRRSRSTTKEPVT
ncbi:MAG: AMP-binding protein, partial [Acidimicrobiales bacterium]|nr:AMP-binding protein [Acidimicrobiales bacterium]